MNNDQKLGINEKFTMLRVILLLKEKKRSLFTAQKTFLLTS